LTGQESSCPAGAGDGTGSCGSIVDQANRSLECSAKGFNAEKLSCKTCKVLEQRLAEFQQSTRPLLAECFACCQADPPVEVFRKARLICDASSQERDQDLHDFIKRKAPKIHNLEVDYQEGSWAALELENDDGSGRVLRADVSGWKSNHLRDFLGSHLEGAAEADSDASGIAATGAWSAEIQSCSG